MELPWQLPGVERYLDGVVKELRQGSSVLLHLPPHAPEGIEGPLRDKIENAGYLHWIDLSSVSLNQNSVPALTESIQRLISHPRPEHLGYPASLAGDAEDTVFWVPKEQLQRWTIWQLFLESYRLANHTRDESKRGVFCVEVESYHAVPDFDIGLAVKPWHGVVTEIDGRVCAECSTHSVYGEDLLTRSLKIAIAAELGGYDLTLVETLAEQTLDVLLDPRDFLFNYADSQRWLAAATQNWSSGGVDQYRHHEFTHSCLLRHGRSTENLEQRLWRAQLLTLFPHLEQRRMHWISHFLRPLQRKQLLGIDGESLDPQALEFGQLMYFLNGTAPRDAFHEWRLLRDIRNALAHLRPACPNALRRLLGSEVLDS